METSNSSNVDARGMKCPWPALRAARAMRMASQITVEADDPIAARELEALARQQGWRFAILDHNRFLLARLSGLEAATA